MDDPARGQFGVEIWLCILPGLGIKCAPFVVGGLEIRGLQQILLDRCELNALYQD